MIEQWNSIEGTENRYQVSSYGRVKRVAYDRVVERNGSSYTMHIEEHFVKTQKAKYEMVSLFINGKQKLFYIHRLVAAAFIPNPNNLPEVNHKNEDKYDNRVENLEWCTHNYNINYGTGKERAIYSKFLFYDENGHKSFDRDLIRTAIQEKRNEKEEYRRIVREEREKLLQEKKDEKSIVQVSKEGEIVKKWNSVQEIVDAFGITSNSVYNSLNRKTMYCKKIQPVSRFIYKCDYTDNN